MDGRIVFRIVGSAVTEAKVPRSFTLPATARRIGNTKIDFTSSEGTPPEAIDPIEDTKYRTRCETSGL
jgi:hypothetical protein